MGEASPTLDLSEVLMLERQAVRRTAAILLVLGGLLFVDGVIMLSSVGATIQLSSYRGMTTFRQGPQR